MKDLRNFVFSYRSFTPIPLAILLIYFSSPIYPYSLIGLVLVFFGEIIRMSAVSHAGGRTRTTKVGAPSLCKSGPYSRTRNPLYLGNVIIYGGVCLLSGGPYLVEMFSLTIIYFIIQYTLIISLEEETLTALFKDDYLNYCKNVPRLFPRLISRQKMPIYNTSLGLLKTLKTEKRTLQNIALFIATIYSKSILLPQLLN